VIRRPPLSTRATGRATARALGRCLAIAFLVGACSGPAGLAEPCERHDDCEAELQCFGSVCQPRCERRTDCGDGFVCDSGLCVAATVGDGGACDSELDCAAGLACHLDVAGDGTATCGPDHPGGGLGSACRGDDECRNGTCALGRCIDLCADDVDCPAAHACATIPRPSSVAPTAAFAGCIPARGLLSWSIPATGPRSDVVMTVPSTARSVSIVIEGSDPLQAVGLARLAAPSGSVLYAVPASPADYYANAVRHRPAPRISVVQLPGDDGAFEPGAYAVSISSFRPNGSTGTATPRATVFAKVDDGATLDVHFYFLDLDDHPCAAELGDLDADAARTSLPFQQGLVDTVRATFADAGVALGEVTYDDLDELHDLDGIEAADLDTLLAQSSREGGVHVFVVRTLAPAGLLAMLGRAPGAPGPGGTAAAGLAIAADGLCYRTWPQIGRLAAHEIARHLGLARAVEIDGGRDRLADTGDDRANLLHFADDGGTALSESQKRMLQRSPSLR
jgi:hypothetical protein